MRISFATSSAFTLPGSPGAIHVCFFFASINPHPRCASNLANSELQHSPHPLIGMCCNGLLLSA